MNTARLSLLPVLGLLAGLSVSIAAPTFAQGGSPTPQRVTVVDATRALQVVVGTLELTSDLLARYDVAPSPGTNDRLYGDGRVDISDVIRILQGAVGLVGDLYPVDHTQLFTLNGGSGFSVPGSVSVVDLRKARAGDLQGAITVRAFETGSVPNDLDIVGDKGYLVNSTGHSLQVIDMTTLKPDGLPIFLGTDANPAPNPMQVAVSGNRAYVTLLYGNEVAVVDLSSRSVAGRIPVGVGPQGILAWGKQVYVTNTAFTWNPEKQVGEYGPGTVSVIDPATDRVIGTLDVPQNPSFIRADSKGRLHVSSTGNFGEVPGVISIFNGRTDSGDSVEGLPTLIGSVAVGGAPGGTGFAPNGAAYAVNGLGGILKYDPETLAVARGFDNPIPVVESPVDLAVDSRGRIYAALFSRDQIAVLDSATDLLVQEIPVGDGPEALTLR